MFLRILKILLLFPFSFFYGTIVRIKNFLYDFNILKSSQFDIPIISVGNISVGGTGKTPHVEFLVSILQKDFKPAVLSRGYQRKTKGFREVKVGDNYLLSGDEPLQIKEKFPEIIVAVCENRKIGIKKIIELHPETDLIILDDAFQHRRVKPGLSILLINYNKPIKDDHLLPIGRLREPANSSHRADILIYTKCPEKITSIERRIIAQDIKIFPYQSLYFSKIIYQNPVPVFESDLIQRINDLDKYKVIIITGIANPEQFVNYISTYTKNYQHLKFPDHHKFKKSDFEELLKLEKQNDDKKIIITTEKDAVRIKNSEIFPEELKSLLFCIPIKIEVVGDEKEKIELIKKIYKYVRENKRNKRIHI
ncbi:MAG: tetraacyldisaccharide 4'-kinase [Bacteroidales bacterium]